MVEDGVFKKFGDGLLNCEVLAAWNGFTLFQRHKVPLISLNNGFALGLLGLNSLILITECGNNGEA